MLAKEADGLQKKMEAIRGRRCREEEESEDEEYDEDEEDDREEGMREMLAASLGQYVNEDRRTYRRRMEYLQSTLDEMRQHDRAQHEEAYEDEEMLDRKGWRHCGEGRYKKNAPSQHGFGVETTQAKKHDLGNHLVAKDRAAEGAAGAEAAPSPFGKQEIMAVGKPFPGFPGGKGRGRTGGKSKEEEGQDREDERDERERKGRSSRSGSRRRGREEPERRGHDFGAGVEHHQLDYDPPRRGRKWGSDSGDGY